MSSDFQPTAIALFIGFGILIMVALALVVLVYANRARQRILQQQMATQALELRHQQELVQRNLLTQEEERQRIAAHLHDDIGSKLGVLSLTFHRLRRSEPAGGEEQAGMFEEINGLIANTLDAARRISHELLPPTLEDFGLIAAIEELGEQLRKTGATDFQFSCSLDRAEIGDATTELNLFRIVQELSNNSLKYARAKLISVDIVADETSRRLCYRDDGQGFDPDTTERKGLGMKNIESRAKIIGGHSTFQTAPGQGFAATVIF